MSKCKCPLTSFIEELRGIIQDAAAWSVVEDLRPGLVSISPTEGIEQPDFIVWNAITEIEELISEYTS